MSIPRMRTASQVLDEIKKLDPETAITHHYVKQLIHEEAVPVLKVGRKKLVNVDDVLAYMDGSLSPIVAPQPETGRIRRVQ